MIETINRDYVAADYIIADNQFPPDVPALAPIRDAYLAQREYKGFFATTVVLDPDGALLLGYTGRSYPPNYKPGGCMELDRYRPFLKESLERYKRVRAIQTRVRVAAQPEVRAN